MTLGLPEDLVRAPMEWQVQLPGEQRPHCSGGWRRQRQDGSSGMAHGVTEAMSSPDQGTPDLQLPSPILHSRSPHGPHTVFSSHTWGAWMSPSGVS